MKRWYVIICVSFFFSAAAMQKSLKRLASESIVKESDLKKVSKHCPSEVLSSISYTACVSQLQDAWKILSETIIDDNVYHKSVITAIEFINDQRAVVGDATGHLFHWDFTRAEPIVKEAHAKGINSLSVSKNGIFVASASEDKTACVWQIHESNDKTSCMLQTFELKQVACYKHLQEVRSVAINNGSALIVTGCADGAIFLYKLEKNPTEPSDGPIKTFWHSKGTQLLRVEFLSNQSILSMSADQTIKVWNEAGDCLRTIGERDVLKFLISAKVVEDQNLVFCGYANSPLELVHIEESPGCSLWKGKCSKKTGTTLPIEGVSSIALNRTGSLLALGYRNGDVRLFGITRKKGDCSCMMQVEERACFSGHARTVYALALSPEGLSMVSGANQLALRTCVNTAQALEPSVVNFVLGLPKNAFDGGSEEKGQKEAEGKKTIHLTVDEMNRFKGLSEVVKTTIQSHYDVIHELENKKINTNVDK